MRECVCLYVPMHAYTCGVCLCVLGRVEQLVRFGGGRAFRLFRVLYVCFQVG